MLSRSPERSQRKYLPFVGPAGECIRAHIAPLLFSVANNIASPASLPLEATNARCAVADESGAVR